MEKLIVLAPVLMLAYNSTEWNSISTVFKYFHIPFLMGSKEILLIFGIFVFIFIQTGIGLSVFHILFVKEWKRKKGYGSLWQAKSLTVSVTAHITMIIYRVLLIPITSVTSYLILYFIKSVEFHSSKSLDSSSLTLAPWAHYFLFSLMIVCFLESLIVAFVSIFCLNDYFILRFSPLGFCSYQSPLLELLIKLYVAAVFSFDSAQSGQSIVYFISAILFLGLLTLRFFKVKSQYFFADLGETFYESFTFLMHLYIALKSLWLDSDLNYEITPILVLFAGLFSLFRGLRLDEITMSTIKSEEDAINFLKQIAFLCMTKEKKSVVQLSSLLSKHIRRCGKEDCICRTLLSLPEEAHTEFAQLNLNTYSQIKEIPEKITSSWKIKVLSILVIELHKKFMKCEELTLLYAEISFFFLANHFNSITLLSTLSSRKPSMSQKIKIYYLRQIINFGMENEVQDEEAELMSSLEYHDKYQKFLSEVDDLSDLSNKFWSTLLAEVPNTGVMNTIGVRLFNVRKRLISTVKEINQITTSNVEFYVRYGLCMKMIMHDSYAASVAFNNINRSSETITREMKTQQRFSLLKSHRKTLMIVISLETTDFMIIKNANDEVEDLIQYHRKELMGSSIVHLMLPLIGQMHHQYVNNYFQSMKTKRINEVTSQYLKNKEGMYVSCKIFKCIVPKLEGGFQGVLFGQRDRRVSQYTDHRKDKTVRITGVILCSRELKILGFTREVAALLQINERSLLEITNKSTLDILIPQINQEKILKALSSQNGAVIEIMLDNFLVELDMENEEKKSREKRLIWGKIVEEKYGENEVAKLFLISLVSSANIREYFWNEEKGVFLAQLIRKAKLAVNKDKSLDKNSDYKEVNSINEENLKLNVDLGDNSNTESDMSQGNSSVNTGSSGNSSQNSKDMIDRAFSEETPPSIQKLAVVIVLFISLILGLILVEAILSYNETSTLEERFFIIEAYELRYMHSLNIYNNAKVMYVGSSGGDEANYAISYYRLNLSKNTLADNHVLIVKYFHNLHLYYGSHEVTIWDHKLTFNVIFNHAIIKLINRCISLLSFHSYSNFVSTYADAASDGHELIEDSAIYIEKNVFSPLRLYQQKYSNILKEELSDLANSGETTLNIVIGLCVGIVIITIGLISPVFFWVIRDKSFVLAIFADIAEEEIKTVIKMLESFDVKYVKYRKKWLMDYHGSEDKFWNKVLREQKNNKQKQFGIHLNERSATPEHKVETNKVEEKASEKPLKEGHDFEMKQENLLPLQDDIALDLKINQKLKLNRKKQLLSQLDPQLRNNAIIRLLIVLFVFLVYGGVSLYFNYFFHNFNSSTSEQFYVLQKRSVYIPTVSSILRKAVRSGEKFYLIAGGCGDNMDCLQEVLTKMFQIETDMKNFEKHGSESIFPDYFEHIRRYNSYEFCSLVDSLSTKTSSPCASGYQGPLDQGLSGGMSYLIEFHDSYGMRVLSTNFSDPNQVYEIQNNDLFKKFLNVVHQYILLALEDCAITFRKEAVNFFEIIKRLAIAKAVVFGFIFLVVYLVVFIYFLNILKMEIWQTHSIINMIPDQILDKNKLVQEQVWKRKGINHSQRSSSIKLWFRCLLLIGCEF